MPVDVTRLPTALIKEAEVVGWTPYTVGVKEISPTVAEVTWYFTHRPSIVLVTDSTFPTMAAAVDTLTRAMLERLTA